MTPHVRDPATGLPIGPEVAPTPARRPTRDTVLTGRHVRLAALDPAAHAPALYRAVAGGNAAQLYLYLFPPPPADEGAFRTQLEGMAKSEDPLAFAILDEATGEAVGHATYMRIEPTHRVIEVGNILYTPPLQRSPGAPEAMYLMA